MKSRHYTFVRRLPVDLMETRAVRLFAVFLVIVAAAVVGK